MPVSDTRKRGVTAVFAGIVANSLLTLTMPWAAPRWVEFVALTFVGGGITFLLMRPWREE